MVDDQDKALKFYTEMLGFVKKHDIPMGGQYRWLTVISPEGPNDLELILEPNKNGVEFQQSMFAKGIPMAIFNTSNIAADFARLKSEGVEFTGEPVNMGPVTYVRLNDTCGNFIQLNQSNK